ncbi:DNA mismatch repair endonuclease MutL [Rurimicrobium arvi]|uniref:DNA mismatch repair protein MutL n=1 Tax=Rurimicrobium arvi TaxID=2049916 RepID=A0ABP8MHL0_9BACT
MADIIHLLSDHIANQIAAGEVIQRPASAVKELLENAVDAGATEVQLVIRDAGKELVQVIDNGKGMSPTDARMSFERHATSKINKIEDLFSIRTMGFRGEALASMAAVGQMEMKTRQRGTELGTHIVIEGTEVKSQEPCAIPEGTNICLKNLFFNVPARRNFLKSNTTELRNILDEFTRVVLAFPEIGFRYQSNGVDQYRLTPGSLKARIVSLFGNSYDKKLVPVSEQTDFLNIQGFVGRPDAAMKTRGMQYFFLNKRFIRSNYLNHALTQAYEGLIPKDQFPVFFLFLEIDPARVDVNVHPTKQEVKFEDDKLMYAYLNSAVKAALARNNMAPALDFDLSAEIQHLPSVQMPQSQKDVDRASSGYLSSTFRDRNQAHMIEKKDSMQRWKELYDSAASIPTQAGFLNAGAPEPQSQAVQQQVFPSAHPTAASTARQHVLLVQNTYLVSTVKSGLMYIHIRRALERIWYERFMARWEDGKAASQQLLFPISYEVMPQDEPVLTELLPDLQRIGFDIHHFGKQTFVVQGIPVGVQSGEEKLMLDELLERNKQENQDMDNANAHTMIARLARRMAMAATDYSAHENQQALIDELFACMQPEFSPFAKKIFGVLPKDDLDKWLS